MTLQIDFNNPEILRGYLSQAIPQVSLEEARRQIVVGKDGGLAYFLFTDFIPTLPFEFRATSFSDMGAVREYFDAVQRYVAKAEQHAKKFGFRHLHIGDKEELSMGLSLDSFIYQAGIGDVTIESVERLERFLDMVKKGKGKLDEQYDTVKRLGADLKINRR